MDLAPRFGLEPEQGWSPRVGSSMGTLPAQHPGLGIVAQLSLCHPLAPRGQ